MIVNESFIPYRKAAHYLWNKILDEGIEFPLVGIVCGSGLSELSNTLEGKTMTVKYSEIPGFPAHCTVAGHKGEIVFGKLSGIPAICFRGRFHSYEGHDMKTVVLPINVMRCLQVKIVILTNAAGGLNPDYKIGDVVCVSDHFAIPQLAGKNALVGPNDDEMGPRFPPTSNAYNDDLREAAMKAAKNLKFDFVKPNGTYCFVSGPMYESKAECKFLRMLGGDTVGMSTAPEAVTAHHCNMQVLVLSMVTNMVVMEGDDHPVATHAEVLEATAKRSEDMQALVKEIIGVFSKDNVLENIPDLPPVSLYNGKLQSASTSPPSDSKSETLIVGAACLAVGILLGTLARR